MSWPEEIFPASGVTPVPKLTLVGYRNLETGVLYSVRAIESDRTGTFGRDHCEPIYTGGPELVAPLLEALIHLSQDRSEGVRRQQRFLEHRFAAQKALGEFVELGGRIP